MRPTVLVAYKLTCWHIKVIPPSGPWQTLAPWPSENTYSTIQCKKKKTSSTIQFSLVNASDFGDSLKASVWADGVIIWIEVWPHRTHLCKSLLNIGYKVSFLHASPLFHSVDNRRSGHACWRCRHADRGVFDQRLSRLLRQHDNNRSTQQVTGEKNHNRVKYVLAYSKLILLVTWRLVILWTHKTPR